MECYIGNGKYKIVYFAALSFLSYFMIKIFFPYRNLQTILKEYLCDKKSTVFRYQRNLNPNLKSTYFKMAHTMVCIVMFDKKNCINKLKKS